MHYLHNVVSLKLDEVTCVGCEMCIDVCPHAVFAMKERKATVVDHDACMECGACARNCPVNAIAVAAGTGCATGLINNALGRKEKELQQLVNGADPAVVLKEETAPAPRCKFPSSAIFTPLFKNSFATFVQLVLVFHIYC